MGFLIIIILALQGLLWVTPTYCSKLQTKLDISSYWVQIAKTAIPCGESYARALGTRGLVGRVDAGQQAKRGRNAMRACFPLIYGLILT